MVRGSISDTALQAKKRAIAKTLGYRAFMLVITVATAWIVVGDMEAALNIGLLANIAKTGTYYLYERAWDHVTWGVSVPT